MKPNKLDLNSMDGTRINLEALYKIAPSCFTEVKDDKTGELRHVVNFTTLRQLLGDDAVEDTEMYQFTWPGKQEARLEAARPIDKTLRPVKEDSVDWDNTQNLYIEGDNLEVLKLLQKSYMGKIKMIYIDPPYNTGEDFLYEDNTVDDITSFLLKTGSIDEFGNKYRKNVLTDGRFHSKWCSNIYSRLTIAKSLLSNDGVIFISIDDGEVDNLIKICNEIFGEANYLNCISVKTKASSGASGGGEDRKLKKNIEYILVYTKSHDFSAFQYVYNKCPLEKYIEDRKSNNKSFAYTTVLTNPGNETYLKTIKAGNGDDIELYKVTNFETKSVTALAKEEGISNYEVYEKYLDSIYTTENAQTSIRDRVIEGAGTEDDYIIAKYAPVSGRNKGKVISVGFMGTTKRLVSYLKVLCEKDSDGKVYKKDKVGTLWDDLSWSSLHNESSIPFPNAQKPLSLILRLLEMQSSEESIILDFYSGSSTTAHAVFLNNINMGFRSKFIMVQIPEVIDPNSYSNAKTKEIAKKAITFLDSINKPHNICELGKERIRIAGNKIKEDYPLTTQNLDTGFRVFRVDDSNFEDVELSPNLFTQGMLDGLIDNVKKGRNDLDLLFGAMLAWGVQLSLPMTSEEVDGKMIYTVNNGDLVACFAEDITERVIDAIAEKQPLRVLFRDRCFNRDDAKINIFETLKQKLDWSEEEALKNIKVI